MGVLTHPVSSFVSASLNKIKSADTLAVALEKQEGPFGTELLEYSCEHD